MALILLILIVQTEIGYAASPFPACERTTSLALAPDEASVHCPPRVDRSDSLRKLSQAVRAGTPYDRALNSFKNRLSEKIQNSIRARVQLIECLGPRSSETECHSQVEALRQRVGITLKQLRIALALSSVSQDPRDHSINAHPVLPVYVGMRALQALSPSEVAKAQAIQKKILSAADQFVGSRDSNERERHLVSDMRRFCSEKDPDFLLSCQRYDAYKDRQFVIHRDAMGRIANQLIGAFPFVTRFDELPITDAKLKQELSLGVQELKKWNQELASDPGALEDLALHSFRGMMNQVLEKKPSACMYAFSRIKQLASDEKQQGLNSIFGFALVGICGITGGAGCLAAIIGEAGLQAVGPVHSMTQEVSRRAALTDMSDKSQRPETSVAVDRLQERYSDILMNIPFGGGGGVDSVNTSLATGESLSLGGDKDYAALVKELNSP